MEDPGRYSGADVWNRVKGGHLTESENTVTDRKVYEFILSGNRS